MCVFTLTQTCERRYKHVWSNTWCGATPTHLHVGRCVCVATHHGNTLATHCHTLQHTSTNPTCNTQVCRCYNAPRQHICNTLQHTSSHSTCNRWSSWQCVAVCCSVLLMCCRGALRHLHNCVLQVEFVAVCCSVAGGVHGYGEQYTYIAHGNTVQHIPDTQRTHIVRVPLLSSSGGVRGFRERCRASSLGCWCVCVWERERERVSVCKRARAREWLCVCERESVCESVCVSVYVVWRAVLGV